MDKRMHDRTGDNVMSPFRQLSSLALRILDKTPKSGPDAPVSTIVMEPGGARIITSSELQQSLRSACTKGGGASTFGYSASEIGTRSIRSGAAMGLFLMNHPVAKIMILGRWSSDAFLDYIRPQVLEWTNQLSTDMIRNNSFFDAADSRRAESSDPRTRAKAGILLANGCIFIIDGSCPTGEKRSSMAGPPNIRGVGAEFTAEGSPFGQAKHQSTNKQQHYW